MMSGIHHIEQLHVPFGDLQHFELQPQETDAHPDPETSCTANYDMPGDMEQKLLHIYNHYKDLEEKFHREMPIVLNPEVLMCGTSLHPEQHFELQPQGTDAHPDPETSCTANYDMPVSGDKQELQHIYNRYKDLEEMFDREMPIVLNPEVLMCGTSLHPEPQLTFSSDGLKMEYLDSDSGHGDLITLFWEVSDIISIDCKWIQMVQSALITLHVRSSAEIGNSGPVKVEFCLADPQWERKQQKIWQLDSRYQEAWKNIQSDDFTSQNWSAEPSLCFPKQYFHGTDDFEEFIYPKGERDAVSISSRDVELLLPEIFVNDTIIDFYIKYLTRRIEPTERHRYHFFSSFFFRKLADLDKDQENAPKGREAFLHVRKWTRKIDVFAKEFLFIPVNFSLHWSLLVICYPGEVDTYKDGDARIAGKLPCIMHMNSIKGTHSGLKDIIQSYLWEEWKERHPESASDSSDKFLNLRFLSLELPQQDNLFDCGLFLLHYVERFLMDAPSFFNPMKIDAFSSFLGDDWFAPAEASLKRSLIRKLIHELVTDPSKNYPTLICGDEKLDILDSNQKISSHAEVEAHEHDLMIFKCCPSSDNVDKVMVCQGSINEVEDGRCEASQDIDSVTMLDASKHDTGTGQEKESTEGKADNGRCDLSEETDSFATGGINMDVAELPFERDIVEDIDDRCDLSEDPHSVMIDDMNSGVAECWSENSTVKAVDPGAAEDDTIAEKTSTTAGTNIDNEQYVSSESKDANSSIMSSRSTVSCGLSEGNVAGGTTNGTSETHADGEDACHNLVIGEVAPCGTDAETPPHVEGIIEGSAEEKADRAVDKMNGTEQHASYELEDENANRAARSEQHDVSSEAKDEKSCVGSKRPFPNSSICKANEMVTLDDNFWKKYSSERTDARFGRRYKRRIVWKRRREVIPWTPPSSCEYSDSD